MANLVSVRTLEEGHKNLVVQLNVSGDASGEETATMFVDISTYAAVDGVAPTKCKLLTATSSLVTFDMVLLWDATTDVLALPISSGAAVQDFRYFGGLSNTFAAGWTGDIRFTTIGLGASDYGTVILELRKDYD